MLSHSVVKRDIIVFAPSTKWVQKQNWVFKSFCQKIGSGCIEHKNMTIMKWVSNLECIHSIGLSINNSLVDLFRSHSVSIHTIIEFNISQKSHAFTWHKEVTLSQDYFNFWMRLSKSTKYSGGNLFFTVIEEDWLFNDSKNLIGYLGAFDSDFSFAFKPSFFFSSNCLGDWYRKKMLLAFAIGDLFHVNNFQKFFLIHESVKRCGPTLSNCLNVLCLFNLNIKNL